MIDTLLANLDRYDAAAARSSRGLEGRYAVATLHRPANVDTADAATALVSALHGVADQLDLVLPLHPRGRATLEAVGLLDHPRLHVEEPLGYVEFMGLVRGASLVLTDSGGVQEETTVLGVPCLTMRPNTERPITITDGTNRLVATRPGGRGGTRGAGPPRRVSSGRSRRCGTATPASGSAGSSSAGSRTAGLRSRCPDWRCGRRSVERGRRGRRAGG